MLFISCILFCELVILFHVAYIMLSAVMKYWSPPTWLPMAQVIEIYTIISF